VCQRGLERGCERAPRFSPRILVYRHFPSHRGRYTPHPLPGTGSHFGSKGRVIADAASFDAAYPRQHLMDCRSCNGRVGTVEVVGSLLPGGASTIHAIKGEWEEFTISVAGDAAYLLSGPLAKAAETRKRFVWRRRPITGRPQFRSGLAPNALRRASTSFGSKTATTGPLASILEKPSFACSGRLPA
jgi:hypothetical protein